MPTISRSSAEEQPLRRPMLHAVSERQWGTLQELLLVLPFLLLFLIQLIHHQLWGDELNAWAIAVASPTLAKLFFYLHYEAHPSLWYLMLWPLARWTAAPVAMKLVEAVVGVSVYLVLALKSPFSRAEKLLVYIGYFISFEYTVPSRMYGVLLLLALVYAQGRSRHPERFVANAFLLGLMANTDTMGILLSAAFALEYACDSLVGAAHRKSAQAKRQLAAAACLYLAGVALSIATLKPAKDISRLNSGYRFEYARSFSHLGHAAVSYLVLPWFPIARGWPRHFWNPNPTSHAVLYTLALPFVVGGLYRVFRRDRSLLVLLGAAALIGVSFGHLIYMGWERHYGILFIAFLVALWIQQSRKPKTSVLAYVFLGLSALGGIQAAVAQWTHPFSNAESMARWIQSRHLQDLPMISLYDMGIAEVLERPVYFLECRCTDTFVLFSDRRDHFDWNDIPQDLDEAMRHVGTSQALFINMLPLTPTQLGGIERRSLSATLLLTMPNAEVTPEGNYLYLISRVATPAHSSPFSGVHATSMHLR